MKRSLALASLVVLWLAASLGAAQTPAAQTPAPAPSVKSLLERARTQMEQKNPAGAMESLRRARTLAPNSEEVLSRYAEAALGTRAPLAAIPVLSSLVRIAPTVADYRYRLGRALLEIGDAAAAVASLREADRLEPGQAPTLVALGAALTRRGQPAEARPVLQRALSLDPDGARTLAALAAAEEAMGEGDAAEDHAQRALQRSGAEATAWLVVGRLRARHERWGEAREALQKSAAADPDDPAVHEALGRVCAQLGDAACSQKHGDLARLKTKEQEDRVKEARRLIGFAEEESRP